jgi:pimeloyl-ACP methyl ester carboxylesterase
MRQGSTEQNGVRLHWRLAEGPGPALTLIHGGYLDSRAWEQHLEALSDRFTVLAPDVRGYGDSTGPGGPWAVSDWGSDLLALWSDLGIDRSYLLGFSMGGLIALDVASRAPERLAGLILVSTTARFSDEARERYRVAAGGFGPEQFDAALARHLEVAFTPSFRDERPDFMAEYERRARGTPLESVRNTMLALGEADYTAELAGIELPALVIHGTADQVTGGAHPAALVAGLPDVREEVLEGAGHTLHLERPEVFAELVTSFVDEVEARG